MKTSCFFCVIALVLSFSTSAYAQWGSGYDDYTTPNINEGAIGSGYDDYTTPNINEGAFGSNYGNRTSTTPSLTSINPHLFDLSCLHCANTSNIAPPDTGGQCI